MTKKRGAKARTRNNAKTKGTSYTTSLRDLSGARTRGQALIDTALIGGLLQGAEQHLAHNPAITRAAATAAVARFVADTLELGGELDQASISDDYLATTGTLLTLHPGAILTAGQSWATGSARYQEGQPAEAADAYLSQHVLLPCALGGFYEVTMELSFDGEDVQSGYSVTLATEFNETGDDDAMGARLAAIKRFIMREVTGQSDELIDDGWLDHLIRDSALAGVGMLRLNFDRQRHTLEVHTNTGRLFDETVSISGADVDAVVTELEHRANVDFNSTTPVDTSFFVEIDGRQHVVRCSSFRRDTAGYRTLILRLPDLSDLRTLDHLGMSAAAVTRVRALLAKGPGVILFAGAMGAGRTTSAYAALLHQVENGRTAFSVECPVEKVVPGVTQISQSASVTPSEMADVMYYTLRMDQDVMLYGELSGDRDANNHVVRAALAGRQVLSTIHANDSMSGLLRLIQLSDSHAGAVTNGVIAQKIVQRLNAEWDGADPESKYSGTAHLFEILVVDDALRDAIAAGATLAELHRVADILTFTEDGERLVALGITDAEAVRLAR